MNVWRNAVITDDGLNLLAKLTQGSSLTITRAVSGKGFVSPDLLGQQKEVSEPMQELKFLTAYYPKVGECALPVLLSNEGLVEGYKTTQIGVFANDPDNGEILYLILQTVSAEIGTIIPSEEEMPGYTAEWKLFFQYGQADNVVVTTDPANMISRAEMEEYVKSEFTSITNEQIALLFGMDSSFDPDTGGAEPDTGGTEPGTDGTEPGTGGTLDHSQLVNRNIPDQHTISAITGLEDALLAAEGTKLAGEDIEAVWNNA